VEGDDQLAIAVVFGSVEDWLRKSAVWVDGGWLLPHIAVAELKTIRSQLGRYIAERALPIALCHAATEIGCDESNLGAAVDMHDSLRLYDRFICPTIVGARVRRTLHLVELLAARGRGYAVPLGQLVAACQDSVGRMTPSYRDVTIVLAAHRHLFINLYEEGWATCIPTLEPRRPASVAVAGRIVSDTEDAGPSRSETEQDDGTLRSFLTDLLGKQGPMPMNEIRDAFDRSRLVGHSRSSIGPILLFYEDFIRLAPGVYSLRADWVSGRIGQDQLLSVLLSESHCVLYAQARWAGEPRTLYPAWTEEMELDWARWALRTGNKRLLESLLAVTDPAEWAVGDTERRAWLERLRSSGRYDLAEPLRVALDATVPTFTDILSAGLWARQQGHLSWMSANRTTGHRVDDRHAASILALLIAFGILLPAPHWQRQHIFCTDATTELQLMLDHAFKSVGDWPERLASMTRAALHAPPSSGWLGEHDLRDLLQRVSAIRAPGQAVGEVPAQDDSDIFTELKERIRRDKLADILSG